MQLNLSQIRIDGGTQPRAELRGDVIAEYAELMRAGAAFPPVAVFHDGQSFWLADGFHRYHAWRRARPDQAIEAEVHHGTLEDARWFSYGVNKLHGLRRTNADKEQAIRTALRHPKALTLSNNQIAAHCGVDERTVRRYRRELEAQSNAVRLPLGDSGEQILCTSYSRLRIGLDGRTIDTTRIGSARRGKTAPPQDAAVLATVNAQRPATATNSVTVGLTSTDPRACAHQLLAHLPFEYLEKVFLNVVSLHRRRPHQNTT